jgi:hypothetical protein
VLRPEEYGEFKPNVRTDDSTGPAVERVENGSQDLVLPANRRGSGPNGAAASANHVDTRERPDSAAEEYEEGFLLEGGDSFVAVPELTPAAPDTGMGYDHDDFDLSSTHVRPEDPRDISFPRIQNKANRTPDDTLSAIKGSLYKPSATTSGGNLGGLGGSTMSMTKTKTKKKKANAYGNIT